MTVVFVLNEARTDYFDSHVFGSAGTTPLPPPLQCGERRRGGGRVGIDESRAFLTCFPWTVRAFWRTKPVMVSSLQSEHPDE